MDKKNNQLKSTAEDSNYKEFPELKVLDYQDMYDLVTKFIQNTILIKDIELAIITKTSNKISFSKLPFILLQIANIYHLPDKTYTVNKQKISLLQSEVMMNILFFGNEKISSVELAQAFNIRFNKGWASEQFAQYSKGFIPLYSNNLNIKPFLMNANKQFEDRCSIDAYFELHPEIVICNDPTKDIVIDAENI
ncbi:hypothetical protein [Commensalibacter papalotli (ex Servin-Garciduenas et al. 2014)]|uniref:Uncharacterized protein n=1 Tax=Commensalibacter papalotli (ex Servin-Garciduenas et al. 2014) TaxID=1208583 RepID=W7DR70_9PROT|nr:hypothetical protein [Commensalibacter papalotli (ex Servin-Garciduenas et al. 2014)]EUK17405.1 hypothetical protein COMX_10425 [Commensalibacter papalotli (ex Servin-Garciduenas et al. 2014)]